MGWVRIRAGLATALFVAVSACGPGPGDTPEGAGVDREAALVSEFELCAAAGAALPVCAAPELRALTGELARVLALEAKDLSAEGVKRLAADQASWAHAELAACADAETPDLSLETCMARALRERLKNADQAVQMLGGFTFLRAEHHSVEPIPAGEAAQLAQGAPRVVARRLAWPRIDAPSGPAAERFNAAAARQPPPYVTDEAVDYAIAYAGPALISVEFQTYSYAPGAAHPNTGLEALNLLMETGEPLTPRDVFKPGSGWEEFLMQTAEAGLAESELGGDLNPALLRDAVTKPRLWVISAQGLTLLFPPYVLGGPFALGAQKVLAPWAELKPFLKDDAPAPFGAS